MTKQEVRKEMGANIKAMTDDERRRQSLTVCEEIARSVAWQRARVVLLYCAMHDEISLQPLINEAYEAGKLVVLPVVDGNDLLLRLYHPDHMAVQGKYQIEEPTEVCKLFSSVESIELALIPGRAFTPTGDRLGRGKGYYDRLLPAIKGEKWGVGFSCQLIESLPTDPWDVKLDRIVIAE